MSKRPINFSIYVGIAAVLTVFLHLEKHLLTLQKKITDAVKKLKYGHLYSVYFFMLLPEILRSFLGVIGEINKDEIIFCLVYIVVYIDCNYLSRVENIFLVD